ncbi:hypothetical protein BOO86_09255 [Mycobacterium sp. CBMA 234]|uniref:hypothetical protein n=1 Tax=Mycolicibacterium sp. CBMA 234 TaxID=1918495 RepID=UPI0012DE0771|nr:hypothetical protein [Mycolicibacterium sp. CBMA 234]MUL64647.1 hypothetical protein [Mycolicibacterium sp. CBMA 234]
MLESDGAATDPASSVLPRDDRDAIVAGRVAKVVAGIPLISQACEALRAANCRVNVAGNRITVDDEFFVVLIGASGETDGGVDARWVIYPIAGGPPVWVVGAERAQRDRRDPVVRASMDAAPIGRLQLPERRLFSISRSRTHVHERRWP